MRYKNRNVYGWDGSASKYALQGLYGGKDALANANNFFLMTASTLYVYNGATFDRVQEAPGSSNLTATGVLGVGLLAWDGTNYRSINQAIPSDGSTNSVVSLFNTAYSFVFNGTSWDRARSASVVANTTGTGLLGVGVLAFDGTNYQRLNVVSAASPNLKISIMDGSSQVQSYAAYSDGKGAAVNSLAVFSGEALFNGSTGALDMARSQSSGTQTSAAAAANILMIQTFNLKGFSILVETNDTNFGTAAMTIAIDVSIDNATWKNILAATALAVGKTQQGFIYDDSNLLALSTQGNTQVGYWPYFRITISAPSATKTSTITWSGKQ